MVRGMPLNVQEQFGQIDIYVFDQILRGNIAQGMRVLDAGCGYGRNLVHLLREGCEVFALDADRGGVEHVRQLSARLGTGLPAENFQVGVLERSQPNRNGALYREEGVRRMCIQPWRRSEVLHPW